MRHMREGCLVRPTPREHVAYLLWCIDRGYLAAEDRDPVGGNWFADDPAMLHPDDAETQRHLLLMADVLLGELREKVLALPNRGATIQFDGDGSSLVRLVSRDEVLAILED